MKARVILGSIAVLLLTSLAVGADKDSKPASDPADVIKAHKITVGGTTPLTFTADQNVITMSKPKGLTIEQKLQKKIPRMDFDDTAFEMVVPYLGDISDANIDVNWQALAAAGIGKDAKVGVHIADVTFEKALKVILANVGGTTPLAFTVDQNVITISVPDETLKTLRTLVQNKLPNEITATKITVLTSLKESYEDPLATTLLALGQLRESVDGQTYKQRVETMLQKTKSTGVRNALQLALIDLQPDKAKKAEQIEKLIEENDAVLHARESKLSGKTSE